MVDGLDAVDKRSGPARLLLEWRRDLVADLGGEAAVTAQQRALVEVATRTKLYVDHLDAFLMQQRSLINKTRKTGLPVLLQRQRSPAPYATSSPPADPLPSPEATACPRISAPDGSTARTAPRTP